MCYDEQFTTTAIIHSDDPASIYLQALQDHILRKDIAFPEITRMIVPNEVVAHIIGKGKLFTLRS
jgi:hypothetical protein